MFSKNVILFFCAALYFLQCQSGPNPEQLNGILEEIGNYSNSDGIVTGEEWAVNLTGVRDIIGRVKYRLSRSQDIPSIEGLKSIAASYTYDRDDVTDFLDGCIGDAGETDRIRTVFDSYGKNHITYGELEELIIQLKDDEYFSKEVPYYSEPKTSIPCKMSQGEFEFNKHEVEYFVSDYLFPDDVDDDDDE
ncbi:uncharacterized protein LOC126839864 [Adelges cooleyi]|uniref:uncharacterized protein LOC126839864 n=1 Tax=Adelges cooleyi TaxID=133065 RepID=UPI0021804F7C|nr:uncharacterized protein LOC126839864 [Adelges cooleyi]